MSLFSDEVNMNPLEKQLKASSCFSRRCLSCAFAFVILILILGFLLGIYYHQRIQKLEKQIQKFQQTQTELQKQIDFIVQSLGKSKAYEQVILAPIEPHIKKSASVEKSSHLLWKNFNSDVNDPAIGQRIHVIAKGDTLGALAKHYQVSIEDLAEANIGLDPKRLQVGQKLIIPERE